MRDELARIRSLATDILLMADNSPADFAIDLVEEMAEEIAETSSRLFRDVLEAEKAEILAEQLRV